MMAFGPDALLQRLHALGAAFADAQYLCAVSGGTDSMALLHALAQIRPARLRAIHVNHGLHPDAASWAQAVQDVCTELGVALQVIDVAVPGESNIEEAARHARYAALAAAVADNEILLTAHHQEDQALTVLIQLLRGAGPAGLAAMPAMTGFARGHHARPLLDRPRAQLEAYCRSVGLRSIADPSNDDERFARNYLRRQVQPVLERRWPRFATTLSRSAAHCAEAADLLQDLAQLDAGGDLSQQPLDLRPLLKLTPARLANVVRGFLSSQGLRLPNRARLDEFVRQLRVAGSDKAPALRYDEVLLQVYRQRLFAGAPVAPPAAAWCGALAANGTLTLPGDAGVLRWPCPGAEVAPLTVTFRHGGEVFGAAPTRSLKSFLQSTGVLPWRRASVPLCRQGERLVGIGDLWQDPGLPGRIEWLKVWPTVLPEGP